MTWYPVDPRNHEIGLGDTVGMRISQYFTQYRIKRDIKPEIELVQKTKVYAHQIQIVPSQIE